MCSLPQGWGVKKLGEVAVVSAGNSAPQDKSFFKNGVFPFIRTSDVGKIKKGSIRSCIDYLNSTGIRKLKLFEKGTILFPKSGASTFLNHRVIMDIDGYVSSHLATIKPNEIFENKFVWYYLVTIDARNLMQDIAYPSLKLSDIKNILIPLPPLPEQKRIVAILDQAFTAIDQAKANTEKNLKNARELFQSKLQETFDNGKLKIDNGEWEEKKLGEVCQYDKNKNTRTDLPYVGLENIESDTGKFIGSKKPSQVKSSTFYFSSQHILYGRLRPYLNKVLLPDFSGHCSTEIFPIKANKLTVREFLFYWFMMDATVSKINATWTGARMPRANMKEVINFYIGIPPLPEQKRIVKKLDVVSTETKKLEAIYQRKITCLDELKKSILQKAFSGEL